MLQSCSEKLAVNRKSHFSHTIVGASLPRTRVSFNRPQRNRLEQPVKVLQISGIDLSFAR